MLNLTKRWEFEGLLCLGFRLMVPVCPSSEISHELP